VKDTRAGVVKHFVGATWHYPDAVFAISAAEREAENVCRRQWVPGIVAGEDETDPADGAEDPSEDGTAQDEGDEESTYSVAA
jgi:hypothetical protein